jgi:hypothetical protein
VQMSSERIGRTLVLAVSCAALASCDEGVLSPKGPIGRAEKANHRSYLIGFGAAPLPIPAPFEAAWTHFVYGPSAPK